MTDTPNRPQISATHPPHGAVKRFRAPEGHPVTALDRVGLTGRPGTVRSKVGWDAIDEPCTNRTAGLPSGEPTNFSHRNSFTSLPLLVQCSTPVTAPLATFPAVND